MSNYEYPALPEITLNEGMALRRYCRYFGFDKIAWAVEGFCDLGDVMENVVFRIKNRLPPPRIYNHAEVCALLSLLENEFPTLIDNYKLTSLLVKLAEYAKQHEAVWQREYKSVEYASGEVFDAYEKMRHQNDVGDYDKAYTKEMEEFFSAILSLARNAVSLELEVAELRKEVAELRERQPAEWERPEHIIPDDRIRRQ